MLALPSGIEGPANEDRSFPKQHPKHTIRYDEGTDASARRIGLEQEFFLVDRTGELSDLAEPFIRRCRESAEEEGLDPRCFKPECVKNLLEITTPPSASYGDLARSYLRDRGRVRDRPRAVPIGHLSPPDKSRSPRRSRLRRASPYSRTRQVLARWQMRGDAPAPGVAGGHCLARHKGRDGCFSRRARRAS
jgi:hypothetical protein